MRSRVKRIGGMARIGGVWFVGGGWEAKQISRTLAAQPGIKAKALDSEREPERSNSSYEVESGRLARALYEMRMTDGESRAKSASDEERC